MSVLGLAFTGLPVRVFPCVVGTKTVRATATMATVKIEFEGLGVGMSSEDGVLAIS